MANETQPPDRLDPMQYTELVRAALHPDERQFFKSYLGQESPDIKDYLLPQGRFDHARQLREGIVRQVLQQTIPSLQNPKSTVAEQQGLQPGAPIPPNAMGTQVTPLEGPGAPVSTGIMPGQGMTPEQLATPTTYGTMQDSTQRLYNTRSHPFFQEGPQPTSVTPTVNPNAILPPAYQANLDAEIHKRGLRGFAPNSTIKADALDNYLAMQRGEIKPDYQGHMEDLATLAGITPKEHGALTPAGRLQGAKASIAEAQVPYAGQQAAANVAKTQAGTTNTQARTKTEDLLRDPKLEALIAKTQLMHTQASTVGQKAALADQVSKLQEAKFGLALQKYMNVKSQLSPEDNDLMMNQLMKMGNLGTELKRDQPGFIDSLLGNPGAAHLQANPLQGPVGNAPTGNPMQFSNGAIAAPEQGGLVNPEPITSVGGPQGGQPSPEDKRAMAKALYDRMKEGDVQTFDGVKYTKQGSKLVPTR